MVNHIDIVADAPKWRKKQRKSGLLIMLLILSCVVLTGCDENEEERIRQALTDMGYMDGVSESDMTAEAETEPDELLAAASSENKEDPVSDISAAAAAIQNAVPSSEETDITAAAPSLPNPAEVLPNPAEVLPNPAEVLPNPAEVLPNPADLLPDSDNVSP